jgi:HSP20 family protein
MSTTMTTTHQEKTSNDRQLTQQNGVTQQNGADAQNHHSRYTPRFDIWEGDEELILYCDLPGVDPDHLHIQFENRELTLNGKVCRRNSGVDYLHSEYGVGDFYRSFMIGEAINADAISAELKDGVLTLHLPKAENAKPRRIEVKNK